MKSAGLGPRYEVLDELGAGRHTIVYRVRDTANGLVRAFKTLREPDPERGKALEAEFLLLCDIEHPAFPRGIDFSHTPDGRPGFSMTCVDSPDLFSLAGEAAGRLPAILHDTCLALRVLHHRGLLHGDIKPQNLKLARGTARPCVRVLDLGLARPAYRGEGRRIHGTAPYLAPEILRAGRVDDRADIYALGASIHAALAGHPPFEGRADEIVERILSAGLPSVRDVCGDLPEPLTILIDAMTARRPADRPRDVEDVIRRLGEAGYSPPSMVPGAGALYLLSPPSEERDAVRARLLPRHRPGGRPAGIEIRTVAGPPGSGRTRLLGGVRSRLKVRGFRTLRVLPAADGGGRVGLRGLAADAGLTSDDVAGETDLESTHALYRRLVDGLRGRPTALFLIDPDRLDRASRLVVEHLLRELAPDGPLCYVAEGGGSRREGREEETTTGWRRDGLDDLLEGDDPIVRVRREEALACVDAEETARRLDGLLGATRGREELAGEIHRWTSGAAALVREVLAGWVERGVLRFSAGEWVVQRAALAAPEAYGRVTSIAAARAAAMAAPERSLLRLASVLGDEFRLDDLSTLAEGDGMAGGLVDRLLAPGGALRRAGNGRVRFRDGALRSHLHEGIAAAERRSLHRRALEIIAARGETPAPLTMAVHHREAGDVREAIRGYRRAVEVAARAGELLEAHRGLEILAGWARTEWGADFEIEVALGEVFFEWHEPARAAEAFGRALAVGVRRGVDDDRLEEVRIWKARCLIHMNHLEEAAVLLRESGARVGWRAGDRRTAWIQREMGWIHYRRGCYRDALRFYRRCMANARRAGDAVTVLHLCNDLAVVHAERGEAGRVERWTARAIREGRAADRPLIVANAYSIRGWSHRLRAEYAHAMTCQRKALDLYRRIGDAYDMARTYNSLGQLYRERGELERAVLYLERAFYLFEGYPRTTAAAHTATNLGLASRSLGRLDRSCDLLRRGVDVFLGCGDRGNAAIVCGDLLETRLAVGRPAEAEEALEEQRRCSRGSEKPYVRVRLQRAEGLIELEGGRHDRAAKRLGEAAEGFRALRHPKNAIRAVKDRARALLAGNRAEAAAREAARALEWARQIGSLELEVESCLVGGLALERLDRMEEAAGRFREAVERIAETPYRWLRAEALHAAAGFLYRRRAWRRLGEEATRFDAYIAEAESLYRDMGLTGRWKEVREMREEAEASVQKVGGRELFTLYEAGRTINSTLSITEILDRLMDRVIETMEVERAVVFLRDAVSGELHLAAARNVEHDTIEDARTFSTTVLDAVEAEGRPLYIRDCRDDPACAESESISKYSILSVICVPLRDREDRIGTIYVDDRRANHLFGEEDVTFLTSLADLAAIALRNARLHQALETAAARLREENLDLRRRARSREGFHGMVGRHESMSVLREVIEKVARTDATVLIRGENGTGKEIVARAVHDEGARRDGPFVVVNCAAIPEGLLEAEIFGVEAGTATGVLPRIGKFEQAAGGTLFLDEVGDMTRAVQAKFLRVLQEKRFERVGGRETIEVDVRILAATNKDLEAAMEAGGFREDLFYRLNTIPIHVPPLRRRREDIPLLAAHFLCAWAAENGRDPLTIDRAVMEALVRSDWPGNVRQLRNVVERMAVLCDGGVIGPADLPAELTGPSAAAPEPVPGALLPLREIMRVHVRAVYRACGGKKKRACEVLDISYKTLCAYLDE